MIPRLLRYRLTRAAACVSAAGVLVCGCAGRVAVTPPPGYSVCALLDSLYDRSGFERPVSLRGKATFDVDQHRVRGTIVLDTQPSGDITVQFESSVLFGSEREDLVFSLVGDTLRLLDRERGEYFEGAEAERIIADLFEMEFAVKEFLRVAAGKEPPCDKLTDVRISGGGGGEVAFSGRFEGERFKIVFGRHDRRLEEIHWPIDGSQGVSDRLKAEYEWRKDEKGASSLRKVVLRLERRDWRCLITSTKG